MIAAKVDQNLTPADSAAPPVPAVPSVAPRLPTTPIPAVPATPAPSAPSSNVIPADRTTLAPADAPPSLPTSPVGIAPPPTPETFQPTPTTPDGNSGVPPNSGGVPPTGTPSAPTTTPPGRPAPINWDTAAPGSWTGQGLTGHEMVNNASQWNPTMSNDPVIIAQVNQMLANGIDTSTGRQNSLSSAVLSKGYRWQGNGDIVDPNTGATVGNAFTLGPQGVAALGNAQRGATPSNPNDQTAYRPPAPTPPQTTTPTSPDGNAGVPPNSGGVPPTGTVTPPTLTGGVRTTGPTLPSLTPASPTTPLPPPTAPAIPPGAPPNTSSTSTSTSTPTSPSSPSFLDQLASHGPDFTTSPTNPANNLAGSTITPGQGVDRYGIASQRFDDFVKQTDPAYQASLRDALRTGAAAGGLGSGDLNTHVGNLTLQRGRDLQTERSGFLTNALEGSIGDSYHNIDIALQQQGFQSQQQRDAFQQGLQQTQVQEMLKQGDFQRAAQMLAQGGAGDPTQVMLALSAIFGDQASAAGKSLADLIRGTTANRTGGTNNDLLKQIQDMLAGRSTAPNTAGTDYDPTATSGQNNTMP